MSRVLRRPMFRGGIANSDGTGITSGLDNKRQGYADGPTDEGVQQDEYSPLIQDILGIKDFLKLKGATVVDTLFNVPVNKASEYITGYNPGLSAVRQMQAKGDPTFAKYDPDKAYFFNTPTEARKGPIRENIEYKKEKAKLANKPKEKVNQYFNENNVQSTKKDLSSFYDEYMSMINKANLVDKDELTKQKYLELAKFGLNLMGQPGGPPGGKKDLFGAISRAAEKPLEGYSNILSRESQMKQIPKQLALQASINAMAPGQLEKNIQGLINAGLSPKKALEFVTKEGTYQQRIQDREEQGFYSPMLEQKFKLKNPTLQQAASKSFVDWLKIDSNLNIGQISPIPADKDLAIDKKYYIDPNTGVIVRFDKKINNYREAGEI